MGVQSQQSAGVLPRDAARSAAGLSSGPGLGSGKGLGSGTGFGSGTGRGSSEYPESARTDRRGLSKGAISRPAQEAEDAPRRRSGISVPSKHVSKLIPCLALLVFAPLFAEFLTQLDAADFWHALRTIPLWQWASAALFTALSFAAVGRYDVLVHQLLDTKVPDRTAHRSGVSAIALAQALGFGAITGALVRWRCLPHLKPADCAKLSGVVSLSFLAALAAICVVVVPAAGLVPLNRAWTILGLASIPGLIVLAKLGFRAGWLPRPLNLSTLTALLGATFLDTACAAAALWILWPDAISLPLLFAAYLVALGAGLVSSCPGGIGAFDLTLLSLLSVTEPEAAAAALIAFRIVYYVIPALFAAGYVLGGRHKTDTGFTVNPPHPETGLAQQDAQLRRVEGALTLTLPHPTGWAIYGDLPRNSALPKGTGFYKCSAKQALRARAAGLGRLTLGPRSAHRPARLDKIRRP